MKKIWWIAGWSMLRKHTKTGCEVTLMVHKKGRYIELVCWGHRKKVVLARFDNPRGERRG